MSAADHTWHPWLRIQRVLRVMLKAGVTTDAAGGQLDFGPEPEYPSLSKTEIMALPEGERVIVTWSGGHGPHQYHVHWNRGEPYAQTEEEHRQGRVDVEKWLTYYVGPRRPFTRVWAVAVRRTE